LHECVLIHFLQITEIFTDKNVKAILVNVFGGIVNCATIASGIVGASKSIKLKVPLIVRLEGTLSWIAILELYGFKTIQATKLFSFQSFS